MRDLDIRTEAEFDAAFPDEATCHDELYDFKWPDGWRCPDCGNDKMSPNKNKQFQCSKCRCAPSVRSGTIFHDGKLTLQTMFKILFYTCLSEERLSAAAIARKLGLKAETVRFNQHKIRVAMADPLGSVPLLDPVARTQLSLGGVVSPWPWPEFPGYANPFLTIYAWEATFDVKDVPPVYVTERAPAQEADETVSDPALEQVLLMVAGSGEEPALRDLVENGDGQGHKSAYADQVLGIGLQVRAWLRDTYWCAVGCHLPKYLVEFAVRYNYQRERLFASVLGAVVAHRPVTYRELIDGGKSPRAQSMAVPVLAPG